jgi:NAD(P)-dependent dehydrogenase (short-subunit alcohol dehydrogenase family)
MKIEGISAVVTGGASGLGKATAERLLSHGARVVITDLPTSNGAAVASELGALCCFVAADVTSEPQMLQVIAAAQELGPLRATVH